MEVVVLRRVRGTEQVADAVTSAWVAVMVCIFLAQGVILIRCVVVGVSQRAWALRLSS